MTQVEFWAALMAIVWLDLLLSGDNAMVIALVCKDLPPEQKKWGIMFGTGAAVIFRIVLAFTAAEMMMLPGLRFAGGLFLIWVAIGLLNQEDENLEQKHVVSLWRAIMMIAIADISMSVDNVMAIAALSKGNIALVAFGVCLSIPIVIGFATIISRAVERFPILLWGGAGLLGWVAGGIIATEPLLDRLNINLAHNGAYYGLCAGVAAMVIGTGLIWFRKASNAI